LKCNKEHVCCNNCFETSVDFSIKLHSGVVGCPVFSCDSSFSEEIVEDNVTGKIYKKLKTFSTPSNLERNEKELKKNEKIIKKNEEVIKKNNAELEILRKEIENLKKNNAQSTSSSSSSTPSKNIINNSKSSFYILSDFYYYFITCVFNGIQCDGIGCCVFVNDIV
jgi:hypothetical protein